MIYVISTPDNQFCKIGYAVNPIKRLATFQTGFPYTLKLVALFEGERSDEADWHADYANQRERGEWFRADPELLAFIEANCIRPVAPARRIREPRGCQINTKVSLRARDRVKKMAIAQAACISDIIEDAIDAYWASIQCRS